jgi:hypothetical protein
MKRQINEWQYQLVAGFLYKPTARSEPPVALQTLKLILLSDCDQPWRIIVGSDSRK